MNRRNNTIFGGIFVVLGVLFLLNNTGVVNFGYNIFDIGFLISRFWPALFLITPGVLMHLGYFSGNGKDAGVLVPGGIFLTVGATCQISMLFNLWHIMWPGFILAVAVGLFELYLFGYREKPLLIPVGILGGLSLIFFINNTLRWMFFFRARGIAIPVVLICCGAAIMLKGRVNTGGFR